MNSFLKDLSSIGISKISIIIFSLGRSMITARWLGPEVNGTIAALTVYPSLFITFGSLGISQSVTHFIGKEKYSEQVIKKSITQIWIFSTIISVVISFLLIYYFTNSSKNIFLVFLAIIPIPFNLFNTYNTGLFLGKNLIKTYNRINWLPTAIIFICTVLFIIIIPLDINGALIAASTGPLFMTFILLFKNNFIQSFNLSFNWEVIKAMLSLGIVYAFSLLIINLNYKVAIVLLDKLSNPFELGIYSKGVSITDLLWQIPMRLSTIVFARSARAIDGLKFSRKVSQLLRLSIILIGVGSIIIVLLSEHIILLLFGNEFVKSTEVLQVLLPGVLLLTIFKVLNMDLAGKGKPWISMKAMIPALLLNVLLSIIFIPKYGAFGSAISNTISYTFAALLFLHFYSKESQLPIREILRYSKSDFQPLMQIFDKFKTRLK